MTGSAGQRRVPRQFLEELEIPPPPPGEQRRIAAVLDQADALLRKRKQASKMLEQLSWAIFAEMFGLPDTNTKRLPRVEFGELIAEGPTNGLYKPADEYGEGSPILRINNF